MVEPQPSKLMAWVRFPSPAPKSKTNRMEELGARMVLAAIESRSADVAQLVEHVLGKDEVIGSIPIVGSTIAGPAGGRFLVGARKRAVI